MIPGTDVYADSNFAPWINADGSLVALTRHAVWSSRDWRNVSMYLVSGPWKDLGEDPFVWRDSTDGVYHAIIHVGRLNTTGLHYFSQDGKEWSQSPSKGAVYTSGGLACRERPHIVLNEGGRVIALTNGAAAISCHGGSDHSITLLQKMR